MILRFGKCLEGPLGAKMLRSFGRLLGRVFLARYPDDTKMLARRLKSHIEPGESVLAAVFVQCPGTNSAALRAGVSAGGSAALGHYGATMSSEDKRFEAWNTQAEELGIDPALARRTVKFVVAVTTSRLLLVRRARTTGRVCEMLAAWPVIEVDRLTVPRGGNSLRIFRDGVELRCELPNEHRFIGQVYRDLPNILAEAQATARTGPGR